MQVHYFKNRITLEMPLSIEMIELQKDSMKHKMTEIKHLFILKIKVKFIRFLKELKNIFNKYRL